MPLVSYALREDQNSIFLLQDAGVHFDKFCQITVFGKKLVKPEMLNQHLYFATYSGNTGKYHGNATPVKIAIEDNDLSPSWNYVAVIESQVEFRVTPSIVQKLSKEHMPAWGVKSYLDYFGDRKSGILLFLRVYKVDQAVSPEYLEKGLRGSAQVLRIYNNLGNESSLPISGLQPVISENKFLYLKDEIIHLLKVEDSLLAQYDSTERGLKSLQERIDAENEVKGTRQRWIDLHQALLNTDYSENDGSDMAQLDYDAIFDEVLQLAPGMELIIDYARNIQAARIGEYDFYLKDVHEHNEKESSSSARLFDMSLRVAIKLALNYHKRHNAEIEDAFQEACIGVLTAIQKHNENIEGLFPSYAAMWIRQVLSRNLPPFDSNFCIPAHFTQRIEQILQELSKNLGELEIEKETYARVCEMLGAHTSCKKEEIPIIARVLVPAESIEAILDDPEKQILLSDPADYFEETVRDISLEVVRTSLDHLSEREREILWYRFGFDGSSGHTLEQTGQLFQLTRERIRQIEKKALTKVKRYISHQGNRFKDNKGTSTQVQVDSSVNTMVTKESAVANKPNRKKQKSMAASQKRKKESTSVREKIPHKNAPKKACAFNLKVRYVGGGFLKNIMGGELYEARRLRTRTGSGSIAVKNKAGNVCYYSLDLFEIVEEK